MNTILRNSDGVSETDTVTIESGAAEAAGDALQIYEIGYHIAPSVKEEDLEKVVASVREVIEKHEGTFIAEGAPTATKLAYTISSTEGSKRAAYDRAYFGWIKFESTKNTADALSETLKKKEEILRFIVWKTVREDTRARMKAPTLREVKRTDTIKTTRVRSGAEESAAPVSEVDLEKAIENITEE